MDKEKIREGWRIMIKGFGKVFFKVIVTLPFGSLMVLYGDTLMSVARDDVENAIGPVRDEVA